MTKILIISDIHVGISSESTNHPGQRRQANSSALTTLKSYIQKFNNEDYDFVVNLGDNIRNAKDRELNKKNLRDSLETFKYITHPKLYVTGNHEYKNLTDNDVITILKDTNESYPKIGFKELGEYKIIWIDSILGELDSAHVSQDTIVWIKSVVKPSDKVILFSHYSICPIKEKDNFYFGSMPHLMSYENGEQIMEVLRNCQNAVAINGHTHMANHKVNGNLNCFSVMAFSENIVNMKNEEINPGIYSVLELSDNARLLKTYSGDYCISRYDF